ncbi:hypothetical protein J7E81_29945 [Bacillus sp. ISL-18]|uniref:hypothetical protein n=1 Tax=Bacillus sp. ISL-18 TaxID=2819118 RepID=UPI001BE92C1F|nr:hypothetical protein [Bacillus sp. ISL-18]MBT2659350.1 hypothetical protein [Bacillus sp. ISL-18]
MMNSERLLYALEIVILFSIPLIMIIFFKSIFNPYFKWDGIKIVFTHFQEKPSFTGIGTASYSLLGYYYLGIFNRLFKKKVKPLKLYQAIGIGIVGIMNLFTSVFIPLGLNGIDTIDNYTFPWIATADSMHMEFGFIERVLFLFLLLYIGMALVGVTISWHVSLEYFKSCTPQINWKNINVVQYFYVLLFITIILICGIFLDETDVYYVTKLYFSLLVFVNVFVTALMFWIKRRAKVK